MEPVGKGIGFLKGTLDEKIEPFFDIYDEMLHEIFRSTSITLLNKKHLYYLPVTFLRGRTLNGVIIVDEAQNLCTQELETCLTRAGEFSTIIFTGDVAQCDLKNYDKNKDRARDYKDFVYHFSKCSNVKRVILSKNYRSPLITEYYAYKEGKKPPKKMYNGGTVKEEENEVYAGKLPDFITEGACI